MEVLATVLEIIMIVCFGLSWPFNIVRAFKAKTTKGTSLLFMALIDFGYICGIACKIVLAKLNNGLSTLATIALVFYIINFLMVLAGIIIYFRNKKFDKERMINE